MKHTSYLSIAADTLSDFFYKLWHHRRIIRLLEAELKKPFEARLLEMKQRRNGMDIQIESPTFQLVAMTFIQAFKSVPGANNYLSLKHIDDDGQEYEFFIQRSQGLRPADLVSMLSTRISDINSLPERFNFAGSECIPCLMKRGSKWVAYAWYEQGGGPLLSHIDEDFNCWGPPLEFESDTIDGTVHLMNSFIKKVQKYQEA